MEGKKQQTTVFFLYIAVLTPCCLILFQDLQLSPPNTTLNCRDITLVLEGSQEKGGDALNSTQGASLELRCSSVNSAPRGQEQLCE